MGFFGIIQHGGASDPSRGEHNDKVCYNHIDLLVIHQVFSRDQNSITHRLSEYPYLPPVLIFILAKTIHLHTFRENKNGGYLFATVGWGLLYWLVDQVLSTWYINNPLLWSQQLTKFKSIQFMSKCSGKDTNVDNTLHIQMLVSYIIL